MAVTKERTMEIVGISWTNTGVRLIVQDTETGEQFRWQDDNMARNLKGLLFGGEWMTYTQGKYKMARRAM